MQGLYQCLGGHPRRGPESNRCAGLCRPLPNHSATPPEYMSPASPGARVSLRQVSVTDGSTWVGCCGSRGPCGVASRELLGLKDEEFERAREAVQAMAGTSARPWVKGERIRVPAPDVAPSRTWNRRPSAFGGGADDGIRTRDPHLGKVGRGRSATSDDRPKTRSDLRISYSTLGVDSRRFAVVCGTDAGRNAGPSDFPAHVSTLKTPVPSLNQAQLIGLALWSRTR